MVVTAQHLASEVGVDILKPGRQRRRCGGGGRLRAGGRLPCCRQYRRRRLHDHPLRRRPRDLPQFPRDGAAGGDRDHVSRCRRATSCPGASLDGYLAVGVPGSVARPRDGARAIRHDAARRASWRRRSSSPRTASSSTQADVDILADQRRRASRATRPPPRSSSSPTASRCATGDRLVQTDLAATLARDRQGRPGRLLQGRRSPTRSSRRARPRAAFSPKADFARLHASASRRR